ncbi:hypothetical protein C1H69_18985 [Billgrantia endophytica]|uniref:Uncharacterized protein n=1 Tax=Billgrantia endophytica TaxID=2033802 RepID=A0A2N7TXZ5_9GAMM|nr:hypothetical protein C1H69_18985 [Halomonas endophytica]
MLQERSSEWPKRWEEKGRQEGRQEGREEGRREAAHNMLLRTQFDDTTIAEIVGLEVSEISALRAELKH